MTHAVSRRDVLNGASFAAVAGAATSVPTVLHAKEDEREVLHEFSYGDVKLTGGPLRTHYDAIHAHYLSLDNDSLLKVYRQHAGLAAPGQDMGGWYDATGFVPGHSFGQYVSGLSRFGAGTGDPASHTKVRYLIDEFGKVMARVSDPYAGPNAQNLWAAYVLDKFEIGLIDAYRLSGVREAANLIPQVIAGAMPFVSPVSRDRIGKANPPYDETYILPENLFTVAEVTGDARYRALAVHYLLDKQYFDPLAAGQDVLPGKHAYSHAMALSSAAKAYLVVGEGKYKTALLNAWRFLDLQRYASGGWGPEELFVVPHEGALYQSLFSTTSHFETPCGSYANTKLARYLLCITGDARYADGLERDIFNTVLATKFPDDHGDYPYYSTYSAEAHKEYYPSKWPCCSGTLVQGAADYPISIYFHSSNRLYVALYAPSQVRWLCRGSTVTVTQETDYPAGEKVMIRLVTERPVRFSLNLRIPGWVASTPEIRVNGRVFETAAPRTSFVKIERMWKSGDTVELTLPQSLRTLPIDESHPGVVALLKGPVMYAAVADTGTDRKQTIAPPAKFAALPPKQDGTPLALDGSKLLVPFYLVHGESYDTYFQTA